MLPPDGGASSTTIRAASTASAYRRRSTSRHVRARSIASSRFSAGEYASSSNPLIQAARRRRARRRAGPRARRSRRPTSKQRPHHPRSRAGPAAPACCRPCAADRRSRAVGSARSPSRGTLRPASRRYAVSDSLKNAARSSASPWWPTQLKTAPASTLLIAPLPSAAYWERALAMPRLGREQHEVFSAYAEVDAREVAAAARVRERCDYEEALQHTVRGLCCQLMNAPITLVPSAAREDSRGCCSTSLLRGARPRLAKKSCKTRS